MRRKPISTSTVWGNNICYGYWLIIRVTSFWLNQNWCLYFYEENSPFQLRKHAHWYLNMELWFGQHLMLLLVCRCRTTTFIFQQKSVLPKKKYKYIFHVENCVVLTFHPFTIANGLEIIKSLSTANKPNQIWRSMYLYQFR